MWLHRPGNSSGRPRARRISPWGSPFLFPYFTQTPLKALMLEAPTAHWSSWSKYRQIPTTRRRDTNWQWVTRKIWNHSISNCDLKYFSWFVILISKACAFCWFWFCLQITVWWILWLVLCSEIHHYKKRKISVFFYHAACTACALHACACNMVQIEQHIWKSKTITWIVDDRTSFWCPSLLNVCMQCGLATRMLSVHSSDSPSVRHVICDKMKETCAHILIPHDRTFILVLLQPQASTPSYSRHPLKLNRSCRKWLQATE